MVRASDGRALFLRRWEPGGNSQATLLLFHGITAYGGPYGPMLAEPLAAAGYTVVAMDLRGHGLSDGTRGDYPSAERFVRDLKETVAFVRSKSQTLVLMGHSLGAITAIVAAKNCPGKVDGLVLLSAARKIRTVTYRKPSARTALRSLIGATLFRGIPWIPYEREGMIGRDDPLFNFQYSARFYSVLYGVGALRLARMLRRGVVESPNLRFDGKLPMPLLVAVGDRDELFTTDAAREFCEEIDCDDKEFLILPGAKHATFPRGGLGPLVNWLAKRF